MSQSQQKEENDCRIYFLINLHESMGPGCDRTRDPWICNRTCNQLRTGPGFSLIVLKCVRACFTIWSNTVSYELAHTFVQER